MVQSTTVDVGGSAAFYALSPMQQGMLFHRVKGGSPGVDIEQVVCELRHPVSAPEFEQAWNLVARRHDALRTTFLWTESDEPRQMVIAPDEVSVPVRVLELSDATDIEQIVEHYLAADRRAGFPNLKAPMLRVALFVSGSDHAWFVLTYHHLILDARGMVPLFRQVLDLHDALARGEQVELPPVRPYREYIHWLKTLDTRRAEAFWREQLAGLQAPTAMRLPSPASSRCVDDGVPAELAMTFSPAETRALHEAARRHEVTLNTLLQGAWAIVLSRYAGEDDVVFGAVRACRHVPVEGAATMIGMLINTVPLRVRLARAASVGHWLRSLREQWVELRDYEHTPLMQVQRWSEVAPGQPLFDTLFNFQEPSWIGALRQQGGVWEKRHFSIRSQPNYPLSLDIYGDESLLVRAFYDPKRFAADAIARVLRHYRAAISALADPHVDTLSDIGLLDAAERQQLLVGFNPTATDYPREACAHREFERCAAEAPERVAVADATGAITYGELNTRADALAAILRQHGVGRDVAVAVCIPRSVTMITAWLAALKAGGAFVPLDPTYPAERLAFQIEDCGAPVVLTQPGLAMSLPMLPEGVKTILVGADASATVGASAAVRTPPAESRNASAADLAYIIYTSGSTGQPKGVEIEHRALMNLVSWHRRAYAITPEDRATHLASPAFDASVWEIWPYLTTGASVHIPDEETRLSAAKLWAWLAEQKITIAFMPTPLAEAALAEPWSDGMVLRALLTGGDQLKRPAPANFPCALVNHYGPTESTVVATAGVVARTEAGAPPIGRPIDNTFAYVLDRELRLVPMGVPGELYLGGDSLARGYHHRPELTAEKFVTNPFADNSTAHPITPSRLYRTGDLVRWRADGQLEFLGRIDHQVKVRGCRVELGEIEAVLQRQPRVREAIVLARPDERGQAQLVGYVVGTHASAPAEADLVAALRGALPAYMVPAAIVVLETWPLTPNGKIDRRALPAPDARSSRPSEFVAPRTHEEQTIAQVWAGVLGRDAVGAFDNFFELGGHSLLAAQAITRLNATLGAAISVRMLFDYPTVAEFATELARQALPAASRPALRPKRRGASPDLELVQPR